MLELSAGEFADYTVHFVCPDCFLKLLGKGLPTAQVSVYCNDVFLEKVKMGAALEPSVHKIALSHGGEIKVRIMVDEGCLQLKTLQFLVDGC